MSRKGSDVGSVLLEIVRNWKHGMGFKQPITIATKAYGERIIGQWGWLKGEAVFPDFAGLHAT